MILGIGNDLANIERIEAVLERHGARFLTRVFTETEQARAARLAARSARTDGGARARAACLAKRWAAKEACSKALGTGLSMGIAWRDMGVANLPSGQPVLHLAGWAAARLADLTPEDWEARVHLTLTDDHPWAEAMVVIEAVPPGTPPSPLLTAPR